MFQMQRYRQNRVASQKINFDLNQIKICCSPTHWLEFDLNQIKICCSPTHWLEFDLNQIKYHGTRRPYIMPATIRQPMHWPLRERARN